jgi:transposase
VRCHPNPNQEGMTVTTLPRCITGGVDTHLDVHGAAALDDRGTLLGVESFATTESGYKKLLGWLSDFGQVELVGVEGTGSYGAGVTRHLQAEGVRVVEIDRPNRQRRRLKGKSDPQDAITAARAALSGDAAGEAKTRDGNVESMRVLPVAAPRRARDGPRRLTRCATSSRRPWSDPVRSPGPQCLRAPRAGLELSTRDQA